MFKKLGKAAAPYLLALSALASSVGCAYTGKTAAYKRPHLPQSYVVVNGYHIDSRAMPYIHQIAALMSGKYRVRKDRNGRKIIIINGIITPEDKEKAYRIADRNGDREISCRDAREALKGYVTQIRDQ